LSCCCVVANVRIAVIAVRNNDSVHHPPEIHRHCQASIPMSPYQNVFIPLNGEGVGGGIGVGGGLGAWLVSPFGIPRNSAINPIQDLLNSGIFHRNFIFPIVKCVPANSEHIFSSLESSPAIDFSNFMNKKTFPPWHNFAPNLHLLTLIACFPLSVSRCRFVFC
jgi:hypothetical protein